MAGTRALERLWPLALGFGGALAGSLVGAAWRGEAEQPTPPAFLAQACAPASAPAAAPGGRLLTATAAARVALDAAERKAIADEVIRALRGGDAPGPLAERPPAAPRPEAQQARRDADLLLDRARNAGTWTEEDATAFRQILPRLASADHDAVMLALVRALNERQLELRVQGPPF